MPSISGTVCQLAIFVKEEELFGRKVTLVTSPDPHPVRIVSDHGGNPNMDEATFERYFGGKAGEQVPQVDPADMKALWALGEDTRKRHPEGGVAIGVNAMQAYCTPGANVMAISYRANWIGMLQHLDPGVMDPLMKDKLDAVLAAASEIPMEWIGGGVRQGWPFDPDDFVRRVREA